MGEIQRYDASLKWGSSITGDGEMGPVPCLVKEVDGDVVCYRDHAAALAAKEDEIQDLRTRLREDVVRHPAFIRVQGSLKELEHYAAQVVNMEPGEDAALARIQHELKRYFRRYRVAGKEGDRG